MSNVGIEEVVTKVIVNDKEIPPLGVRVAKGLPKVIPLSERSLRSER
jgi:hypothetical protein